MCWYISIYTVPCLLRISRISIIYIVATREIMKISDHLVQSLYFLPCGGSNRVYKPLLSICFIYYVSIMVHISFTMVHLSCGTDWYLPKLLSLFYRYMSYAPRISKISWLKSRIGLVTCAIKDWYLPRLFSLFYRFYRCMLYALKVFKISKMKSRIELVIYTIKDWNLPRLLSFYD